MSLRILLIIIGFLFAGYLPAQNLYIRHYTTEDGLPSNMVYQVYQDSKQFIWFATDAGVARFDGSHFDYWTKKDGLNSNEVVKIQEDSFGRIWFFNLNGTLNFFHHNTIYNSCNAPFLDSLISQEFFRKFFQDTDQTIYFHYNHHRDIFALDSLNTIKKYKMPSMPYWDVYGHSFAEGMVIRYMSRDSTGEFLLWTKRGLFKLKELTDTPALISKYDLGFVEVFPVTNHISYGYVLYHNTLQHKIFKYIGQIISDSINSPLRPVRWILITSILEDYIGCLWVSSFNEGIFCFRNNRLVRHFDIQEGQAIIQDHEQNIWISSMKDGVYRLSPYLYTHLHYDISCFEQNGITALAENPAGGVWCASERTAWLLRNGQLCKLDFTIKSGSFNQIRVLKNSTLLIGEYGADYYALKGIRIDPVNMTVSNKAVACNREGLKGFSLNQSGNRLSTSGSSFLFIYPTGQLFRRRDSVDLKQRIFNTFYNSNNELVVNAKKNYIYRNGALEVCEELSPFTNRIITDHIVLNDSIDLFNIEGDTLYVLTSGRLFNLTEAFHYPFSNQIKHMEYDGSRLYLATVSNIYLCDNPLDLLQEKSVHLEPVDLSCGTIRDILVNNGYLYIASDDGLTVIPDTLLQSITTYMPIPYFRSILINDRETDPEQTGVTLKGKNRINLVFGSKSYSSSPVMYSYMLEGADPDWISGDGTNVVYQNLPPGVYVFTMRARKPATEWSNPVEYHITIKATVWQHPLFFAGISILFAVFIALAIVRRKNVQMKRQELNHQLITLEQKALQSMMNPHFIFNALSSIQSYLLQNKAKEAGLYLSQFARLIRQNLGAINTPMILIAEEMERLRNYLDLERFRMSEKFDYTIEMDDIVEEEEGRIPSMIIQPFVENAILHGLSAINQKGLIRILISMHDEKSVQIVIEDNGIGMQNSGNLSEPSEKHLHMGMGMTRKRLEILGRKMHVTTSVTIAEAFPGRANPGTRVTLVVPVGYGKE